MSRRSLLILCVFILLLPISPVASQDGEPNRVEIIPAFFNPAFPRGIQLGIDDEMVIDPYVLFHDNLYHMFYVTRASDIAPLAISYATSTDGFDWVRYEGNPIFVGDGDGFDTTSVTAPVVIVEDGQWVMYYAGLINLGVAFGGEGIGRAIAENPTGPWERLADPLLVTGDARDWDSFRMGPDAVYQTDEGYVMFYTSYQGSNPQIGMATSTDGEVWTKHNDPATDRPQFRNSDPVFTMGVRGSWDGGGIATPTIWQSERGFEMLYPGFAASDAFGLGRSLGYAYSPDGYTWTRFAGNPLFSPDPLPDEGVNTFITFLSAVHANETTLLYYAIIGVTNFGFVSGEIHTAEVVIE